MMMNIIYNAFALPEERFVNVKLAYLAVSLNVLVPQKYYERV